MYKEVHCQKFHNLHQAEGESITHYLVRLRAQASICEIQTPCPNSTCGSQVSYAEDMISGQMIAGLVNVDHQRKVLMEAASLKDLQAKFDKLVSLEATDQATTHLHQCQAHRDAITFSNSCPTLTVPPAEISTKALQRAT